MRRLLPVLLILAACSQSTNSHLGSFENMDMLAPVPKDKTELSSQLNRYRGQTEFLTQASYDARAFAADGSGKSGMAEGASAGREIQESDIYKVGKPGSKLLFLLNNYRGLQVVDFSQGATQPKLVGRVPATGNYPTAMYYIANSDKLLVVENDYESGQDNKSRVLVYDVSQPAEPKVSQTVEFSGRINDTRLVGDVLYVAGIRYKTYNNGWWQPVSNDNKPKGFVTSFLIESQKVTQIQDYGLQLPPSYGELMNIVETNVGGQVKYYLLAALSERGWGWWTSNSMVEVVDITNDQGFIKPVMSISAKGRITERSQMQLIDDTLVVTSNYFSTPWSGGNNLGRIAVETFTLPEANSEILGEDEALYRKLHIDMQLKTAKFATEEAQEQFIDGLMRDKQMGLIGRFVLVGSQLRKVAPDSRITVGDTTGLSAILQDVRTSPGLLYAFWVPQNNIDPLDLFDTSDIRNGIKYLGRLQFDGWIQRAIPVRHNNKNYVVGLGYVIPAVNNETNVRYPQAMLFEIKKLNGQLKAIEVAQHTIKTKNVWADFNAQDKFVEVKFNGAGVGEMLFAVHEWTNSGYQAGAKTIAFDLNKAETGDVVFTEGETLTAETGWLRRVFTNTETNLVNSFSDKALAVFDKPAGSATTQAVAILELARSIRDYKTVKLNKKTYGVQIVSDYAWNSEGSTELRLVKPSRADADVAEAQVLNLKGSYQASELTKDGELAVLTLSSRYIQADESLVGSISRYESQHRLYVVRQAPAAAGGVLLEELEWKTEYDMGIGFPKPALSLSIGGRGYYNRSAQLFKTASGELLVKDQTGISLIATKGQLTKTELTIDSSCALPKRQDLKFYILDGRNFVTSSVRVSLEPKYPSYEAQYNYLTEVTLSQAQLECGADYNIPGEPLSLKNDVLIVADSWATDLVAKQQTYPGAGANVYKYTEAVYENGLTSLKLAKNTATLVDQVQPQSGKQKVGEAVLSSGNIVLLLKDESQNNYYNRDEEKDFYYNEVVADAAGALTVQVYKLELAAGSYLTISGHFNTKAGELLVLTGRSLQVLKVDQGRPVVLEVTPVGTNFKPMKKTTVVPLQGSYYGSNLPNYSASTQSIELPRDMFGVLQILLN